MADLTNSTLKTTMSKFKNFAINKLIQKIIKDLSSVLIIYTLAEQASLADSSSEDETSISVGLSN